MRIVPGPLRGRRHRTFGLWFAVAVLTLAPPLSGGTSPHAPFPASPVGGPAGTALSHLHSWPIPLPPVPVRPIGVTVPAVVNPTTVYHSEPAPMGIGDFGVGAGGQPYTYNTTGFLGNFSWDSLAIANGSDTEFTDQLNVVLQFVQGSTTYAYWIQDVAFMDSQTGELDFEDNIWNFSVPGFCLSNSAVSGNGTVHLIAGCEGYYAVAATTQPGADEIMPSPGDFSLLVRSYLSSGGLPEVAFEYWDGVTSYEVTYDNVVWPWATSVSLDRGFLVDGNTTAPSGNFYDAELSLGGPGGGSRTVAGSDTDASSRLLYWNGHNFEAPRSVWNFGTDTAEAISNVQSFFSHDPDGIPLTTQLNGTSRNATPARAYDQTRVGILSISAPGISSGTVSVAGTPWDFKGGQANLTLVPGSYHVWVNSSSQQNDLGVCLIMEGRTTPVTVPGTCHPSTGTPVATPTTVDIGQSVTFETTVTGIGSGGDSFNWSSLSAALNCGSSTTDSISCQPTASGTYAVAVTITDSVGQTNTSAALEFTVDSDPVVGAPIGTPPTAETGAGVSFTVSPTGGTGVYAFSWAGLPAPCTNLSTAAPSCHPGATGVYSVTVGVTDSNGFGVTSSALTYTVTAGPSVDTPVATPAGPVDVGERVTFSVTAIGGVTPYAFEWHGLPQGCSSADLSSLVCTPTAGGTFEITVSVTDDVGGHSASAPLDFSVNAALEIGSITPSPPTIDLGGNETLSALDISGGDGAYTYSWSGLPSNCPTVNGPSVTCKSAVIGVFAPSITVSDSDGSKVTLGTHFAVVADPSVGGIGVSRSSADIGQTVDFSAEDVSGGVGGYGYGWGSLPSGCVSANSSTIACTPTGAGLFPVTLTVTDAEHVSATLTLEYIVYALPTVTAPRASTTSAVVGQTFELTSTVTPGSGNLSYTWTGLPTGCLSVNSSSLACDPGASGTFLVVLTVRDSNGGVATSSALSLAVGRAPASTLPAEDYLLVGGLAGLVVVATVIALIARRRRRQSAPAPGKSPS